MKGQANMPKYTLFLLGVALGGAVVVYLLKRKKASITPVRVTQSSDKLPHMLGKYMECQRQYRMSTHFRHEFGLSENETATQPDRKAIVEWLTTHWDVEAPSRMKEFLARVLPMELSVSMQTQDVPGAYTVLRILDAAVDIGIVNSLESESKLAAETAEGYRRSCSAEIDEALKEMISYE